MGALNFYLEGVVGARRDRKRLQMDDPEPSPPDGLRGEPEPRPP